MTAPPETIHDRGRAAVLRGEERLDVPPEPGHARWGLSLVVRPDAEAAAYLDRLTAEAATSAGGTQWRTGSRDCAHLTVCYLERLHRAVSPDDPALARLTAVVASVAAVTPVLRWRLTGLALADRGVLALAEPADRAADAFRDTVQGELGALGREEGDYRRGTWWSTLLHFADHVADRAGLVRWVDDRVAVPPVPVAADRVDVVRYQHLVDDLGPRTVPVTLASLPFRG